MTTVEAPATHLRENPYELAQFQLQRVADTFHIDQDLINVLKQCKKAVSVSIPTSRDDGSIAVYEGFNAIPTAEGVGRATTRTVVISAVVTLLLDYMLTAALL